MGDEGRPPGPRRRLRPRQHPGGPIRRRGQAGERPFRPRQLQPDDIVAGLAINPRAFARGIGADHAADGAAGGGRGFWREEPAARAQRVVQRVQHHAWLHIRPACLRIHRQHPVHMPPGIDDDAPVQALPVGAGAAAARRHPQAAKDRLVQHRRQPRHILGIARRHDDVRQDLINGIIGGHRHAQRRLGLDLAAKPGFAQGRGEARHLIHFHTHTVHARLPFMGHLKHRWCIRKNRKI